MRAEPGALDRCLHVLVFFLLVTACSRAPRSWSALAGAIQRRGAARSPAERRSRGASRQHRSGRPRHGPMQTLVNRNQGYDLQGLSELLQQLKVRYPQHRAVTLLVEPDISYDQLVQSWTACG